MFPKVYIQMEQREHLQKSKLFKKQKQDDIKKASADGCGSVVLFKWMGWIMDISGK